jgi:hypothetical protein
MRTLRRVTVLLAALAMALGPGAVTTIADEVDSPIAPVTGSIDVGWLPGGSFDVQGRVFQYRDYAVGGSTAALSEPRLAGDLTADWSWDVYATGDRPAPAWGTMTIESGDGRWEGTFTGLRYDDFDTVGVRAFLFGSGPYEGLCATLDILATEMAGPATWHVDGVVHEAPMMAG